MEHHFDQKKLLEAANKGNGFIATFSGVESYLDDQIDKLDHVLPIVDQSDLRHSLGINDSILDWDSSMNIKKNQNLEKYVKLFKSHLVEMEMIEDAKAHPEKLPIIT